jgi:hypothetical protein
MKHQMNVKQSNEIDDVDVVDEDTDETEV